MPVGKIRSESQTLAEHRLNYPALANKAYFNYGGQGTLSRGSLEEIQTAYQLVQAEGPFSMRMLNWITQELQRTRECFASELGGDPTSYAITHNATEGCNIVFWGIDWKPGDHLIITDSEHPGVHAAAEQVAKRQQLKLSMVPTAQNQADESILERISSTIDERTKLVAISHVLWNTGRTLPVAEIQSLCRKANVRLLIDGAQSAGVIPLDLAELDVDYFAFPGHKWMCGPEGIGALYIRPSLIDELQPTFVGWRGSMLGEEDKHTAAKFEVATSPFPLLCGLRSAIDLHQRWGTAAERYDQLLENVRTLREALSSIEGVSLVID